MEEISVPGMSYDNYATEDSDLNYSSPWLYGYYFQLGGFDMGGTAIRSGVKDRVNFGIYIVPEVNYPNGTDPELSITFEDNIFTTVMSSNQGIIDWFNKLNDDISIPEDTLLLDCRVTFLWTAYVTEQIDMDGVGSFSMDTVGTINTRFLAYP